MSFAIQKIILVVAIFISASCVENQAVRSKRTIAGSNLADDGDESVGDGSDKNEVPTSSSLQSVKVELSHLVDPFDGTYKKKITIPKNYKGYLYLAGLNVAALQDKLVKVRFSFGLDRQSVVLNATVARAPGIVPKTDIQVLMIDMNSKPLSKMRLNYDLFDYNDYSDPDTEVVSNPRDSGLYCRGLKLEDDPTFQGTGTTCSAVADKCLYSYAKVVDATLYNAATGITSIPTRPQVWAIDTSGVRSPSYSSASSTMCLPDYDDYTAINELFGTALTAISYNDLVLGLKYRGPYRAINTTGWHIQGDAIFNTTKGLFEVPYSGLDPYTGHRSLLFPRSGKLSLSQGIYYLGSTDRFGVRGTLVADALGTSKYVDGCNLRTMNYDTFSSEGIGSCNLTSSIEIFYVKDGKEISITSDKTIKLQLIRASLTNYEGKEVLTSAFKKCDNSTTCGYDECCFNSRCWSKELVTQCLDQVPVIGNQEVGTSCVSDFECSSLCCNQATGSCAPHNPNSGTAPVSCGKEVGQRCISKEFCKPQYVETCKIVKLPNLTQNGSLACTLRCTAVETYGDCKNGYCLPATIPPVPNFNPNDCSQAVDP